MKKKIYVYTFYRFKALIQIKLIKKKLDSLKADYSIMGTVLIANEGINGSISGTKVELNNFILSLKRLLKIRKLPIKVSTNQYIPFYRLKIRLKKEIVTIGDRSIDPAKLTGKHILPKDWDKIVNDKKYTIIDTRNSYEVDIGTFKNSRNPQTNSFKDFTKYIKDSNYDKNLPIAMFCTGGIRCEKASSYLLKNGYKNVSQLSGGILNYLEYKKDKKNSTWHGECFVFDNRVTVDKKLKKGKYDQCFGCRHPITTKDKKSILYKKGVSCSYCFDNKSEKKKMSSLTRQKQIDHAERNNKKHSFMKIEEHMLNDI